MTDDPIPWTLAEPEAMVIVRRIKARRHQHRWDGPHVVTEESVGIDGIGLRSYLPTCACGAVKDAAASRRGRNNRKRGGHHELDVARRYGGRKVGPLGGPWDIEGEEYVTQVKTHRGLPPRWWTMFTSVRSDLPIVSVHVSTQPGNYRYAKAPPRWAGLFAAMAAASRTPRLIERYLPGPGSEPRDLIVLIWAHDPAGLGGGSADYVAYHGYDWLDLFGRDESE
jgi:hypothetical protein